jgi:penicillin-binding protein 1A
LENPKTDYSSELYSADGVLLGKYFRYNRSPVAYQELAPHLVQALVATEDYQFENHAGIYLTGIVRAMFLSVILQQKKGGGSTLTQQLAKNLFRTRSQEHKGLLSQLPLVGTLILKTKEWIVAIQLERAYTKQEIITMYLNTVTFGNNAYGIKVAANTFFSTTPDSLTVNQAALLVGLLKAPSYYDPIRHPARALKRRNVVLAQLHRCHFIAASTYEKLKEEPLNLCYTMEKHDRGLATYFRAHVRDFLLTWTKLHGYDLFEDGLKIYTTLDSRVQRHAENAVYEHMRALQQKFERHCGAARPWVDSQGHEIPGFIAHVAKSSQLYKELLQTYGPDSVDFYMHQPVPCKLFGWDKEVDTLLSPMESIAYHKKFLHAGMMAMDPHTGHIKAWVGGINFKHFKYDHVMQGKRQSGSAFKAIVYATAIDNGYSPCHEAVDAPVTFSLPGGGTWTPKNITNSYTGKKMTLRQALAKSVNSITAYIAKQIGIELIVECAQRLGIKSPMDPVPALCLGASEVSVYELTGAYSTFMNKGIWVEPLYITRIEDKYGNIIQEFVPQKKEALGEETAWKMLYMLKGAVEENGSFRGLGDFIKADNELCGKTGTTSNHSDAWCIGMVKDLCTGIWVGGDNRAIHFKTIDTGQGAVVARPLWENFMLRLYADSTLCYTKGPLPSPPNPLKLPCMQPAAPSKKLEASPSTTTQPLEAASPAINDLD